MNQQELGLPRAGGAAGTPFPACVEAWQELWASMQGRGKFMGLRHFWKTQLLFFQCPRKTVGWYYHLFGNEMKGPKQLDKRKNSHMLQISFPLCATDVTELCL